MICRMADRMASYIPRVVDAELANRLTSAGAVVIEGPKAVGKTATARQSAKSEVLLDVDSSARELVGIDAEYVLRGDTPRLIDEWQLEPEIWNHIRRAVDSRRLSGQFILTGSSVPPEDHVRHTGAGRFSLLRMRPMSLFEAGKSSGELSLSDLMSGITPRGTSPDMGITDLIDLVVIGGWPAQQGLAVADAARAARDYLTQISEVDVSQVAGGRRDQRRVRALIRSLARNVAAEVSETKLAADAGGDRPLARDTVIDYLGLLERLLIIEDQPAWHPHLRSRAQLRTSPKRHFVDPSLAVAGLGASPKQLLADLNTFGFMFESLVVRDLRIFAQALDGQVFHYRDNKGREVDAIVTLADGRWGAFEIKLGQDRVGEGAETLLRFAKAIDTGKSGEPAVLGVITSQRYAYRREDGVAVIPIGALGP